MKNKTWIIAVLIVVAGALIWWSRTGFYTEKKGEDAVKVISNNPDAIFSPEAEKKEIEKNK